MDLLRRYLVSNSDVQETDACDIVDKLVDRFQSSIRTEDRRDTLRTLKALSKKYRLEIGTKAMPLFIEVLQNDREDADSVCYALESLYAVMNDNDGEQDSHELLNVPTDLGCQFAEIFIKKSENVALVMGFVDTYEVHIRRNALRLLTVLLTNQLRETQSAILQCPRAISKLVDILSDPREALRNDALLLLLEFTKSHVTIQKIVAFENTFERLFVIIQSEGWSDGGVVVEDCLTLLIQLLDGNSANQILFKENAFVQRLLPLLDDSKLDGDDHHQSHWLAQKIVNMHLTMQIIRALVSPRNKSQNTRICQTHIYNCGLLSKLCGLIMANSVPSDVLTKAIYTLADTIRGCQVNQDYLTQVIAPSEPPQPIITILLVSMLNERQTLSVRTAALYCFQCYVHSNAVMQRAIIASMLSSPSEASAPISIGQLLCGGLFSNDAPSSWFSSIAFSHCIRDNSQLKEDLLRVHLATSDGAMTVSLLQQCFSWFHSSDRFQTKIGLLQLMCTWLAYCPAAVRCFILSSPPSSNTTQRSLPNSDNTNAIAGLQPPRGANLSILIAEVATLSSDESDTLIGGLLTLLTCICILFNPADVPGFDRASLLDTLEKRLGLDVMMEQLSQMSKLESFIVASKSPEPEYQSCSDLVFDYSFTKLFKRLEYEVMNIFQPLESDSNAVAPRQVDDQNESDQRELIAQYEQKLSMKDQEVNQLRSQINTLESQLTEMRSHTSSNSPSDPTTTNKCSIDGPQHLFVPETPNTLSTNEQQIRLLEEKVSVIEKENELLKADRDDLLVLVHDQDSEVKRLRQLVKQLGGQLEDNSEEEDGAADLCDGH